MKKVRLGLETYLAATVIALLALALTPTTARADVTEPALTGERILSANFDRQLETAAIVCTFECQDGIGFLLNPCTDGSLGACCANGEPACADHGGLKDGICQQGRLGLPCVPF